MPNGFWYASGPYTTEQAIPSSAFSKGDPIMLTSASSYSRVPSVATGTSDDVFGVALSASNESIDNLVSVMVPDADTLWWASLATNIGSHATPGQPCDVFFSTNNARYYITNASSASAKAVIVRGTAQIDQSVQSKVLVKLIYNAGNLTLS